MLPAPQIAHDLPGRLRLRLPEWGLEGQDPAELETWVELLPGVIEAQLNRSSRSLVIYFDPQRIDRAAVLERVRCFRNPAPAVTRQVGRAEGEFAPLASSVLTLILLPLLPPPLQLTLTVLKVAPLLARGLDTLIYRGIRVEVLDALAVGLSVARREVYAAVITAFLLEIGAYLERRTVRQSDRLLERLLRPEPLSAWVEREGRLIQVPAAEVRLGEQVVVGPGERVPIDGYVVDGLALVDQSAITGEPTPVRKEPYRRVLGGSVVREGRIRIEATAVGSETTAARIAHFIRQALNKRSTIQREAERLADQRVKITLGSAGAVYLLTRDPRRLQSVFLIDYACALKLGTPVAIKSGMARAAEYGILIRGGEAIEQLAQVDTFVFDKTGTLTSSVLRVTDIELLRPRAGCTERDLLALVASLEEHTSHPIAQAVVMAARDQDLPHIAHGEVDYLIAHGIAAQLPQRGRFVIGSRHYLEAHEGFSFAPFQRQIERLQAEGKTLLYVASTERGPVGLIALRDTLRPETPGTLARLRQLGIQRLVMLSGDRKRIAEVLGRELGFDDVYGEIAPEDKAALVKALQDTGSRVAFVGDGINDGPALAQAEVGIALPRGAEIARATADILLLNDRLDGVATARELATKTMDLIRTNFCAAVGINTALLVAAATGRLSPIASTLLHNGTTLGVLLNALKGVSLERD